MFRTIFAKKFSRKIDYQKDSCKIKLSHANLQKQTSKALRPNQGQKRPVKPAAEAEGSLPVLSVHDGKLAI